VVIEEGLVGEECTLLVLLDGTSAVALPVARDYKRLMDADRGPNTGGMGAVSPVPGVEDRVVDQVMAEAVMPTIAELRRRGIEYRGVLYAGVMLTEAGLRLLEYNVRFGDPEAQPVLMRLKTDLAEILFAAAEGKLKKLAPLEWDPRPSVCVVMAAEGYPGPYKKGHPIRGLEEAAKIPDVKVFHAGTARMGDQVVTDGGRVLGVTALGTTIADAKLRAYQAVKCIRWEGAWCRKDISDKARRS